MQEKTDTGGQKEMYKDGLKKAVKQREIDSKNKGRDGTEQN